MKKNNDKVGNKKRSIKRKNTTNENINELGFDENNGDVYKKNNKYILVIVIFIIVAIVGATYSYFIIRPTGNEEENTIVISSPDLGIEYSSETSGVTNKIFAENILPGWSDTKDFKVTNKSKNAIRIEYNAILVVETNGFNDNSIQYEISGDKEVAATGILKGENQQIILFNDYVIEPNEIHNYTLKLSYNSTDEDQSEEIGSNFKAHIILDSESRISFNQYWDNATYIDGETNTLLATIKNEEASKLKMKWDETKPGKSTALSDEGGLYMVTSDSDNVTTLDDGGASLVYRGSKDLVNNNLLFAGMCWKIVRIESNGAIKIVLSNPTESCEDGGLYSTSAILKNLKYNPAANDNKYLGFKYNSELPVDATFADAHPGNLGDTDGTLKIALDEWYNETLKVNKPDIDDYIDLSTTWCNNFMFSSANTGDGIGNHSSEYLAALSLSPKTGLGDAQPTLKCAEGGTVDQKNASRLTNLYVSLLTADEVAFAGGVYDSKAAPGDGTLYLSVNARDFWWTLTPSYVWNKTAYAWGVLKSGNLMDNNITNSKGLRPALSLKPSVNIISGNGTVETPYTINLTEVTE